MAQPLPQVQPQPGASSCTSIWVLGRGCWWVCHLSQLYCAISSRYWWGSPAPPFAPLSPYWWIDYNKHEYLASSEYLFVILSGFLPAHCRCLLTLSVWLANDNDKTLTATQKSGYSHSPAIYQWTLSSFSPLTDALRPCFMPPLTAHQILISAIGGAQFQLIRLPNADKTFPISPRLHTQHALQSFSGCPFSWDWHSRCVLAGTFWYVFIFLVASFRRCVHAKNPIKRAIKLFRNLHIFRISTQ